MDFLTDWLTDWLKELLIGGIMGNLEGLFDYVNTQVGEIAVQVGTTPAAWNAGVFSLIRQLSETVILPIAGLVLTFVATYELIQMLLEKNNMHEFDVANIYKWMFKTACAIFILSNTFDIVMAVFDVSQTVIAQAGGLIQGSTDITPDMITELETTLEGMDLGPLLGLWLQSSIIGVTMWALGIVIFVLVYGRMLEIYLLTSLAPIPNSTGQQENTSAIPEGAFTPEGTGTVQDNISGTDGEKQFYTITTDAGNVFYLVIDGKREDNNVYFLNGVTESDLMALAEKNNGSMSMIPQEESCNCTEKCEAGKVNTGCPVCKNDLNGCKGKEKPAETEKPAEPEKPKKETGSVGTILFILAALLAVGGIGYYVKIVRPKQQAEDDAEFEDDGYGEGFDPDEAYGEPEYLSEDDFDDKDSK